MIIDLPSTTTVAISKKLVALSQDTGAMALGRVLTLLIVVDEADAEQAIEDANVVVLLLDARQQIADQDAHIAGFILEAGKALVVAINIWDGLEEDERERVKRESAIPGMASRNCPSR